MLTTFYPPWGFGGDAVHVRQLSHALTDRGHDVTVVHSIEAYRALGGRASSASRWDGEVKLVGIDAGRGKLSPALTHLTGRPVLTRHSLERALEPPFDVLHYHNPSLLGGPAALSMGLGLRLYTLHEQWLVCPTHVLFRYRREICVNPHCFSCQISYRRPPQLWRNTDLLKHAVAGLDAILAPSWTSAELHRRYRDSVRIEHLPHFVEESAEAAGGHALVTGDRPYFLCVGRLEPVKGFGRVIDLFRHRGSEDLFIAGTGTLEKALRRQAADSPHVRFLGQRTHAELAELYRGARAAIVPSAGHETFGLVAVEAFAHGTPAIVPAFGALQELVEQSRAGLTYRNERELERAVDRLAHDHVFREALGQRARQAVKARWSVAAYLDRYFALIRELAEARGDHELANRVAP